MTSFLQQLLDPIDRSLPAFVLLDGQALERLDCSFGRVLRLQVGLEDVDVIIKSLQILFLDRGDALQDFAGVGDRLGAGERVGGSGWRLAFDEGEVVGAHAEPFEVGSRTLQVDLMAIAAYMGDLKNGCGARDCYLVADPGHGRWFGGSGFLVGFGHD